MEARDRLTFLQSSTEYSTGTADCHTASYIKRSNCHPPCKAALIIQTYNLMTKGLKQRLALAMHYSQVCVLSLI